MANNPDLSTVRTFWLHRKATAVVCACNLIAAFCILYALLSPLYFYSSASSSVKTIQFSWRRFEGTLRKPGAKVADAEPAKIREAYEARRALEPVELIKRVKEIQEESKEAEMKDRKSPAARKKYAAELTQKLKQLKGTNVKKNQQALEEWRRKKLEAKKPKLETRTNYRKNAKEITQGKAIGD